MLGGFLVNILSEATMTEFAIQLIREEQQKRFGQYTSPAMTKLQLIKGITDSTRTKTEKLINLLEQHPKGLSFNQIALKLNLPESANYGYLQMIKRSVKRGLIEYFTHEAILHGNGTRVKIYKLLDNYNLTDDFGGQK